MHCAPCTQEKNTFRVVENRCLLCVESILVNLPQPRKLWFKKKFKQVLLVFFYTSFWIFWSGIEPFCFCECLFHCSTFDGGAIDTYGWKTASTGVAEVHSSPWNRFFNLWRDGKEALGCKYYRQRVCRVPSTSNVDVQL